MALTAWKNNPPAHFGGEHWTARKNRYIDPCAAAPLAGKSCVEPNMRYRLSHLAPAVVLCPATGLLPLALALLMLPHHFR